MPRIHCIVSLTFRLASSFLLLTGSLAFAAEPAADPARWLEAVVRVHAEIPAEARTAAFLGTKRDGSGVVIDDAGLVVTIGYLITEAMAAEGVVRLTYGDKRSPTQNARSHCRHGIPPFARRFGSKDPQR
jgi:S1-C subfamily serine protease